MTEAQQLQGVSGAPFVAIETLSSNGRKASSSAGEVNILVVDDRPEKLLALGAILGDLGANLVKASSGREALRHLLQRDFALILLDVAMPGMDGFETAGLIRQRLRTQHTPIIFVTSHNDTANYIAKGYSLGAVDYIFSPIVPQVLKTKVAVFVELYKKTEQIKQQAERLLKMEEAEHKKQLTAVLEASPDIVFVVGPDGKIEFTNPAAEEFAKALGMKGNLPSPLQTQIDGVRQTGESLLPRTFQGVHHFRVGNAERDYLPRMVALGRDAEAQVGVAVMLQDVTEFLLLDEIKTNLIATISHELKTPITSIRTVLLMLLEQTSGTLNRKQEELTAIARDETERMLNTLDTLLDLTRFEEGLPGMRLEFVAPEALIENAIEETRWAATTAAVRIKTTVESDLPPLKVDRKRIVLALANLLSNAIKYSPENGEIQVRAERQDTERVRFSVTDQGPGIPEEYQERIFEKFFRVPENSKSGVGLGLTIAREFIRAHGGTIGLNSQQGKGSQFYVVLTKAPQSEAC
ncbi:MAG: ATP-binding protein [Verrucomicrobiota bacterium]